MDPRMKEAARTGEINTLYALIGEDPYVLESLEKVPFVETPLHVAASEGHINMAMEIFNLKPSFAKKLNPDGWSPLHLALRNEQTRLARRLVQTDKQLLRVKGREGMTPFHCVAMEGNSSLLVEFLQACPQCIEDVTVQGETALHLALKGYHFEAFNILVGWLETNKTGISSFVWEKEIANWRDNDGNTVMHIAAMTKQYEAMEILLASYLPVDMNIKNAEGKTASDMLELENVKRQVRMAGSEGIDDHELVNKRKIKQLKRRVSRYKRVWITRDRHINGISTDTMNALLVVAALILTVVYQSCLSPPGGVWQGGDSGGGGGGGGDFIYRQVKQQGTTVMSEGQFSLFWVMNSLIFWITIVLTVRLLPKVRTSYRIISPLTFMGSSYHYSMFIISPSTVWSSINVAMILVYCYLLFSLFYKFSKTQSRHKDRTYLLNVIHRANKLGNIIDSNQV